MERQKLIERKGNLDGLETRFVAEERELSRNCVKLQEMQTELNRALLSLNGRKGESRDVSGTANAASVGFGGISSLNEFKLEFEDWNLWIEQFFDHYINANGIDENHKKSTFLSIIGTNTYALLRDLFSPKTLSVLSYAELSKIVNGHFQPECSAISERYKFKECR